MWRLVRAAGRRCRRSRAASCRCEQDEPLKRELEDFVDAVRARAPAVVTGEDGRRALALAEDVTSRMTTVR